MYIASKKMSILLLITYFHFYAILNFSTKVYSQFKVYEGIVTILLDRDQIVDAFKKLFNFSAKSQVHLETFNLFVSNCALERYDVK